ncbi:unnamed protein product [Linum trigynum]|uniref:Uncharacterized protein n=1 Tax=Linum trigynum TaxID=586398 RepID=A0AAV2GD55_9ROSI
MIGPSPTKRSRIEVGSTLKEKPATQLSQSTRNTVDISRRYVGYSKKVSIPSRDFTSSQPISTKANHFNERRKSHKGPSSWNAREEEDEDYEMEDDGEYDSTDQTCGLPI